MSEETIVPKPFEADRPNIRESGNGIKETVIAALGVSAILVILTCVGKKFENSWIVIAILPVLFWLFFSGRISSFKGFGVELKSAIRLAAGETVRHLTTIDYEPVIVDPKGNVTDIPGYVRRKVAALYFELGKADYYKPAAIKMWLDGLGEHSFFKWVVFQDNNGAFKGLIPAEEIRIFAELSRTPEAGYDSIKTMIENGDVSDLPGLIGSGCVIEKTNTKGDAIGQFSKTEAEYLPVLDQGKFVGVLNRGKLHSSVLDSIIRAADTK